jgi:hypothetical protein
VRGSTHLVPLTARWVGRGAANLGIEISGTVCAGFPQFLNIKLSGYFAMQANIVASTL